MVLTYKMSQTTSNITKTCNKCTNFIKTIKATTQFVVFLFVHSWEQRKFSELVLIERGGSPRPIDDYITDAPDGLNWVKIGDAPTQGHYITKTAEKIKPEGLSKTRQVQPGDLILSNSMSFGKPYIMAINGCIHDGWLLIRDTNNVFDLTFLCHLLGTTQMLGQYKQFAAGSTVNNLNKELVGNTIVTIPSKPEQKVLGEYFESIDNLITLHQREFFRLILAFFCCNSTSILPISWEQRKFEDLYNYASEGGTPDTNNSFFYKNGDVPFVKIEDTESKYIDSTKSYITQEGLSHSSAWLIPENSVIFTNGATVGNVAINLLPVATKQGILGVIPSKKVVTEFLFYFLSSATFQREVRSRMATGTFATIILKNLNQIPVCIPSDKSEQEEIAGYLSAFDNLITLHQRECLPKTCSLASWFYQQTNRKMTSFWEQRKLGDVATEMVAGGDIDKDLILNEGRYPVIANALTNDGVVGYYNEDYRIKAPAVTVTGRGDVGHAKARIVDFTPVVRLLSVKSNHDIFFLENAINTLKIVIESTGVPQLTVPQLAKYEISFPKSLDEEEKIGTYFRNLDNLITLHQCECLGNSHALSILPCPLSSRKMTSFWEQRKLGDIAERFDNLRIPVAANLRIAGSTPYYGANGIQDYVDGYTHDGEFVLVAEDGANDLKNYPVQYVKGRIWVNNHAHVLQGKAKILDNRFLTYVINQADIESLLVGCGRAKLNAETMMNIVLPIPAIKEQQIIGCSLSKLDNLITLHQCKDFSLKSVFEESKNFISALRKNTSWEQRKLGDTVQITMGQSPDGSTYSDVPSDYILVQGNADLQNGWVSPRIWTSQMTKKADAGDLIMSVRAPAGAMGKTAYNAVIGRGVAAIKGNEFIYQLLVKMDSDGYWKALSCGSTFESLNSDNIKNADVLIPNAAEQKKIGQYFGNLDNLITLHQRIKIFFTGDYHDQKNK